MRARDRSIQEGLPWLVRRIPGGAALWTSWQRLSRPEPRKRSQPRRRKSKVRPIAGRHDVACDPGVLTGSAPRARTITPVVCAWCGTSLWAPVSSVPAGPVSHGLCADCARRLTG
jgi:hypothetical protein